MNQSQLKTARLTWVVGLMLATTGCGKQVDPQLPHDSGASTQNKPATTLNATDPRWVRDPNPQHTVAVVFVHGIFGDTLKTWALEGKKPLYDYLFDNKEIARKVDVLAFGYNSNMLQSGSMDIREASTKLDQSLQFHQVYDYKHIVFVAHSMGGLIVLRHLIASPSLAQKVPLVVLFATPQEGSQITTIVDKVANNPALSQMFPANKNVFLQQLDDDWKSLSRKPAVVCGYEKLETYGVAVVGWDSATRFCSEKAPAMEGTDHLTIVKPDRPAHPAVMLLVNALNKHVLPKLEGRLEMPDFVPDGAARHTFQLNGALGEARLVNASQARVRYTIAPPQGGGLYLTPDDTPRDIEAQGTARLRMFLTVNASEQEYRFKLTTDIPSETTVVVKTPDPATLRSARAKQRQIVLSAVNQFLDDPAVSKEIGSLPAEGGKAKEKVARVAMAALFEGDPSLPPASKWLLSADVLTPMWPEIGAAALKMSEQAAPHLATTPAAQHLAGLISQHTGEKAVFSIAPTPANVGRPTLFELPGQENAAIGVATAMKMKAIPQLRPYGLALEGDIYKSQGQKAAARLSYTEAARLNGSPALAERIRVLDAGQVAPEPKSLRALPPVQQQDRKEELKRQPMQLPAKQ